MSRATADGSVLVVGSVNRDYVCNVLELPLPGQTVLAGGFFLGSGGKGANQAVAAARLGARTALVACVGDDADGRAVVADLQADDVDTADVATLEGTRTGAAFVTVASDGENVIVVAPGANARLDADTTRAALVRRMREGDVLITQAEIPLDALVCAVTQANEMGGRVVLNLAPFRAVPGDVLGCCDPLVVNHGEAVALLGQTADVRADPDTGSDVPAPQSSRWAVKGPYSRKGALSNASRRRASTWSTAPGPATRSRGRLPRACAADRVCPTPSALGWRPAATRWAE